MKFRQPSLGTKAAIFLPFLISCTRAHLRMAELGCLASMPLRGREAEGEPKASDDGMIRAATVDCKVALSADKWPREGAALRGPVALVAINAANGDPS